MLVHTRPHQQGLVLLEAVTIITSDKLTLTDILFVEFVRGCICDLFCLVIVCGAVSFS